MRKITIKDRMTNNQLEEVSTWLLSLKDGDEDYFIVRASGFTGEAVYAFDYKITTAFGYTIMLIQDLHYDVVCLNIENHYALDDFLNHIFEKDCIHDYDLIF